MKIIGQILILVIKFLYVESLFFFFFYEKLNKLNLYTTLTLILSVKFQLLKFDYKVYWNIYYKVVNSH